MTKHIILPVLVLGSFLSANASEPGWSVNPAEFKGNMTITGILNINGVESADTNDMVAAFANGECRGVGSPVYVTETERWMVFLLVFGNESFDTLSFRLYDANADEIYDCEKKLAFEMNGIIGDPFAPYTWSYPTLSSEAFFQSFSFRGQIRETVMTDSTIQIIMPSGTDLTNLVAEFVVNSGTFVSVNDVIQESGLIANDFSMPVTYVVLSADELARQSYIVTVTLEPTLDASNFFSPNGDGINDTWLIRHPELYENCEFTIFDSMGIKVLEQTGYNNDWEGKYKEMELPNGTYYYVVKCGETNLSFKGSITLLR